jgi:hypothetical protein
LVGDVVEWCAGGERDGELEWRSRSSRLTLGGGGAPPAARMPSRARSAHGSAPSCSKVRRHAESGSVASTERPALASRQPYRHIGPL